MGELSILEKDVVQANPLIEARKEMNVSEMRLFVLGLQGVKPHIKDNTVHDVCFHETIIPYSDLTELFGNEYNGNITNLKKQVKKASQCVIELSSENGGFGFASIYRKIKYEPNKGLIIHFNDELKPYILELVNQAYTRYKVKAFFSLSSSYAWRILESLLEYQGFLKKGEKQIFWETDIETLRFRLNVPDGLYAGKMCNFRSRILDLPIKEINEKTDYYVWYDVQKTGRKVTGFKIWLKLKNNKNDKQSYEEKLEQEAGQTRLLESPPAQAQQGLTEEQQAVYDRLVIRGIIKKKAENLVKAYDIKRIKQNMEVAVKMKDNAKNLPGLIITFIENDVAGNVEAEKKEAEAREERKRKERRQAYDDFHSTTLVKIGKKEEANEERKEEKIELKELTEIEADYIKNRGKNIGKKMRERLENLGLTIDDVIAGRRK